MAHMITPGPPEQYERHDCDVLVVGAGGAGLRAAIAAREEGMRTAIVSKLNVRHMQLAWATLGTLVLTDLYVMLVASGAISDLRFV